MSARSGAQGVVPPVPRGACRVERILPNRYTWKGEEIETPPCDTLTPRAQHDPIRLTDPRVNETQGRLRQRLAGL